MPTNNSEPIVLVSNSNGLVIIPGKSPLTRLNYFDGKFLRASDLKAEQDYLRELVKQSNQAGGSGVTHGFDLTLGAGDTLNIGRGLGIDPEGRVLLLPQAAAIGIQELINRSRDLQQLLGTAAAAMAGSFEECVVNDSPTVNPTNSNDLYLIVISAADALCGEADVYGRLCEEACATTTDRPFAVEGVIVQAIPLELKTPLPPSGAVQLTQIHYRSQVASAYFEDERQRVASMISKSGLAEQTWCLGALAAIGSGLPIGVIARAGSTTVFLDAWIARRERIDNPPRRYWQWRMMMRPWDVFLAQVLQFQCQLRDLYRTLPTPGVQVDPCGQARDLIQEAATAFNEVKQYLESTAQRLVELNGTPILFEGGTDRLTALGQRLESAHIALSAVPEDRWLINGGIVELPSAGYLPVVPGTDLTINQQVRRMMGEGVDLRFCVVRPDYVAHALEAAQHLERISLIQGLEDATKKPQVDILVPNGQIVQEQQVTPGGFEASITILPAYLSDLLQGILSGNVGPSGERVPDDLEVSLNFNGVARDEAGQTFHAAVRLDDTLVPFIAFAQSLFGGSAPEVAAKEETIAAGGAENEADLASESEPTPEPAARIFTRFKTASARIREQSATASPVSNENASATEAGFEGAATNVISLGRSTERSIDGGIWLTVNCDKDPTKLASQQTLHVNGRAVVAAEVPFFGVTGYIDTRLSVDLFVDEAGTSSGGGFIRGRAAIFGSVISKQGSDKESDSRMVNLEIEITWDEVGGAGKHLKLSAYDPESDGGVEFEGNLGKTPTDIGGKVKAMFGSDAFQIELRSNPDVMKADNEKHKDALEAISVLGPILNDPAFVDTATALLFPPPKSTEQIMVRGTQDWVLFHRRRTSQCQLDVIPPPPPPPKVETPCQTVFQLPYIDALREDFNKRIGADSVTGALKLARRVGRMVFKLNDELDTGWQQAVEDEWNRLSAGGVPAFGMVIFNKTAPQAAQDLYKKQSEKLFESLGGVVETSETIMPFGVTLPPGCPAISIFWRKPIRITVYFVVQASGFDNIIRIVHQGGLAQVVTPTLQGPVSLVGHIVLDREIPRGGLVPADNSLGQVQSEWGRLTNGGQPGRILLVYRSTASSSDRQILGGNAQLLSAAFGGTSFAQVDIETATVFPPDLSTQDAVIFFTQAPKR